MKNTRTRRIPHKRRPLNLPPIPVYPLRLPGYSRVLSNPTSFLRLSTSSSAFTNPDDVLAAEFMLSLQLSTPRTQTVGPPSLPGSHGPIFRSQRPSNSLAKFRSAQRANANVRQKSEAFAHRYCRYFDCDKRFKEKRTTERHRLGHVPFGTYACPNFACPSRTKAQPCFTRDFSLGRHLKSAAPGSPCAQAMEKLGNFKVSSLRENLALAEALIQQALVPYNPKIHTRFRPAPS